MNMSNQKRKMPCRLQTMNYFCLGVLIGKSTAWLTSLVVLLGSFTYHGRGLLGLRVGSRVWASKHQTLID